MLIYLKVYGIIDQYKKHSGLDINEFVRKMNRCYYRIVEIQEDRRRRRGIRGLISKLTGAFVPTSPINKIEEEREGKKDEGKEK